MAFSNRPAGHAFGEEAPSGQNDPDVQSMHAVLPVKGWYLPASHSTHEPCPAAGCVVPAAQGEASTEPIVQNEPAGHAMHCSSDHRPTSLLREPDGHGSAADAPSSQYEPEMHSKQAVSPSSCWYLPASHLEHAPWAASGWTVPGLHAVCMREPVEHDEPEGQAVHWPPLPSPVLLL